MWLEPRIRSELAGTDPKLQLHRRVTAGHTAPAHVGRTLGEGAYGLEHSRPGGPHAAGLAVPRQIEYLRVCLVGVPASRREPAVLLTPRFDVREETKLSCSATHRSSPNAATSSLAPETSRAALPTPSPRSSPPQRTAIARRHSTDGAECRNDRNAEGNQRAIPLIRLEFSFGDRRGSRLGTMRTGVTGEALPARPSRSASAGRPGRRRRVPTRYPDPSLRPTAPEVRSRSGPAQLPGRRARFRPHAAVAGVHRLSDGCDRAGHRTPRRHRKPTTRQPRQPRTRHRGRGNPPQRERHPARTRSQAGVERPPPVWTTRFARRHHSDRCK
jgi:hypothetical protein